MSDAYAIETSDLRKSYDGIEALRGLTRQVTKGSIFGFLGKNGAGKTTTIKVLLGMVHPTGGQARVFGLPASAQESSVTIRQRTGFVSEDKDLIDSMSVDQIIAFTKGFYPKWRDDLANRHGRPFHSPTGARVKKRGPAPRSQLRPLLAASHGAQLLVAPR